jgi:DNA primase
VRPQVGYYHCFGCGESGDVYSFLRAMDHLSFTEAVERLAARIGYTLHYEDGGAAPETSGRTRLYQANTAAAEWFRGQLSSPEADAGRRFLGERGFDAGAAAHFGVGYAPKGWDHLRDAMRAQGFSDEELSAAGLVSQGQRGVYDRFRGRVVWPIRDVTGQTIGFGARRLYDDDKGPKYLNTPETPIYKKAQVLYGLDLAKKDVSRSHRVVVVEGYTDVMACHLAGVTTAIATCGTAFGSSTSPCCAASWATTRRRRGRVHVRPGCRGPEGGAARLRRRQALQRADLRRHRTAGAGPCDLRLERGDAAVRCHARHQGADVRVRHRSASFGVRPRERRGSRRCGPLHRRGELRDPLLQPEYTRVLARRLGMDTEDVRREVDRAARDSARREGDAHRPTSTASANSSSSDGTAPTPVVDEPALRMNLRRSHAPPTQRSSATPSWVCCSTVTSSTARRWMPPSRCPCRFRPRRGAPVPPGAGRPQTHRLGVDGGGVRARAVPLARRGTADRGLPALTEAEAAAYTRGLAQAAPARGRPGEERVARHDPAASPDSGRAGGRLALRELDARRRA